MRPYFGETLPQIQVVLTGEVQVVFQRGSFSFFGYWEVGLVLERAAGICRLSQVLI